MIDRKLNGCIDRHNRQDAYLHLTDVLVSEAFLTNQGLNNDIPFHICPFQPDIHNEVTQLIRQLVNYLQDANKRVLEINLYDVVMEILQAEDDWDWLQENEPTLSRTDLKEDLQSILDVETVITPAITQKMAAAPFDVLFITGVGEVFPYIRSHNILNNLQRYAKDKPTLMFFPGLYQHSLAKGASLNLFGRIPDDKYYRAFNILDRAI
jgi:hypothetical protein